MIPLEHAAERLTSASPALNSPAVALRLPSFASRRASVTHDGLCYLALIEGLVWMALCLFIPLPPLLSNSLTHPHGPSVLPFHLSYKDRNILKHYTFVSDCMQQSCNHSHDYCKMPFDGHVKVVKLLSKASCPLHLR